MTIRTIDVRLCLSAVLLAMCLGPAAPEASEPAEGGRYHHPLLGFSLQLPKGWKPSETGIPLLVRFYAPGCSAGDLPVVECRDFMVVFRGATLKEETIETLFRDQMERSRKGPRAWKTLEEGWTTIGRERVPWARQDFAIAGSTLPQRRLFSIYLLRGRTFYALSGEGAPESFARFEPIYRETFSSFRLEE